MSGGLLKWVIPGVTVVFATAALLGGEAASASQVAARALASGASRPAPAADEASAFPGARYGMQIAQAAPGLNSAGSIVTLAPPTVTPYIFTATRTAGKTTLGGSVPNAELKTGLVAAAGADARDSSAVADGAPQGFEAAATAGLHLLGMLESGKLTFNGASWSLAGTAATPLQALNVDAAFTASGLKAAGWSYDVALPPPDRSAALPDISPYDFKAEKLPAGTLALSGHVPNAGLQNFLKGRAGPQVVDVTKLGAGAPDDFAASAVAGVEALRKLEEGTLTLTGGAWTLTGRTADPAVPETVRTALSTVVDTTGWRFDISAPDPLPPVARPFTWSASKAADGSYTLGGHLGNDGFKRFLNVHLDRIAADTTEIARGEPEGFVSDVLAGLAALERLQSGTVSFDGTQWDLSGVPQTSSDADAAIAALSAGRTAPGTWKTALAAPLAPPEPAPPVVAATPAPAAEPTATVPDAKPLAQPAPLAPVLAAEIQPEPESAPVAAAPAPAEPAAVAAAPAPEPAPAAVAAVEPPVAAIAPQAATGKPIFDASRNDGGPLVLEGAVPAEAARSYFGVIAGDVPTDRVTVADSLPADFTTNASAGIRALGHLSAGQLAFDGGRWSLSGTANDEMEREAALGSLANLPAWQTDVALTPPLELCRQEVSGFSARNSILFQSGKAKMTDDSGKALGVLAGYLQKCPDATIDVEGHTDADGGADLNLALSVARAEAVVAALVGLGVDEQRLYAIGYGESLPVASNDTNAGKQANRRIVFAIDDGKK